MRKRGKRALLLAFSCNYANFLVPLSADLKCSI